MTQEYYTTKKRNFKHLTKEKRAQIEILLKQGMPKIQIAKEIGISRSTLYNELNRGTVEQMDTQLRTYRKYVYDVGQRVYEANRQNSRPPLKLIKAFDFIKYVEEEINERKEFGHWEIDTVLGDRDSKAAFLTLDERKSRKRHIIKINAKTAEAVGVGIKKLKIYYGESFSKIFKSVTSDNGSEFAKLSEQLPGTDIYYAHPYSAWERGTNEKQNSLIRRFFPKGRNIDKISEEEVVYVENWINNLPRKIFNYSTSDEIFQSVLFDIAI